MVREATPRAATTRSTPAETADTNGPATGEEGASGPPPARRPARKAPAGGATRRAATPWGAATVLEEVKVAQRAGEKRFASVVQLLEREGGELLVRFAYTTGGVARRGPVTLRARDLDRLRAAAAAEPRLAQALGWIGGDA